MFVANNWMLLGICVFIALATTWPKVASGSGTSASPSARASTTPGSPPSASCSSSPWASAPSPPGARPPRRTSARGLPRPRRRRASPWASSTPPSAADLGFPPVVNIDPIYDNVTDAQALRAHPRARQRRPLPRLGRRAPPALRHRPLRLQRRRPLAGVSPRDGGPHAREEGESAPVALTRLVGRNRRRYGGYIVHLGFALMMLGYMGAAYRVRGRGLLAPGQSIRWAATPCATTAPTRAARPDNRARSSPTSRPCATAAFRDLRPARFIYTARPEMPTTEVSITPGLREDLYVVMNSGQQRDPRRPHQGLRQPAHPLDLDRRAGAGAGRDDRDVARRLARGRPRRRARAASRRARRASCCCSPRAGPGARPRAPGTPGPSSEHRVSSGMPVGVAESFTPVERHMFDQLLCMCGGCARLPLATCACDFAANTRNTMRARLAAGDSEAQPSSTSTSRLRPRGAHRPARPGAQQGALHRARLRARRGRRAGVPPRAAWARKAPPPTLSPPGDAKSTAAKAASAYDARIDEELRGLDE
jgi:hypothetical protein